MAFYIWEKIEELVFKNKIYNSKIIIRIGTLRLSDDIQYECTIINTGFKMFSAINVFLN